MTLQKNIINQLNSQMALENNETGEKRGLKRPANKHVHNWRFQTQAIHAGVVTDPLTGAVVTPIHQSTTYVFESVGESGEFEYARCGNPTRKVLEDNLATLEGGSFCTALATGQAAEQVVFNLFKLGDHLICGNDVYGGTIRMLNHLQEHAGLEVSYIPMTDVRLIEAEIRANTRGIWIETPSNPLFNIVDIEAVSALAREHDLLSIVDNTLLSPFNQQPLKLGADIVVHSATKYLSGHNDGLGGAVICRHDHHAEKIAFIANALGGVLGAFDAWLILRGIKTLPLRMREHQKSARQIVRFLKQHPLIKEVFYPGLEDHPQHQLIDKQCNGYAGMISFKIDGDFSRVCQVLERANLFYLTESFGGVESLIQHPQTMSHASMSFEAQKEAGITDNLVRISVGLEDVRDLIQDLQQALDI